MSVGNSQLLLRVLQFPQGFNGSITITRCAALRLIHLALLKRDITYTSEVTLCEPAVTCTAGRLDVTDEGFLVRARLTGCLISSAQFNTQLPGLSLVVDIHGLPHHRDGIRTILTKRLQCIRDNMSKLRIIEVWHMSKG
jgi:hypothetical protein